MAGASFLAVKSPEAPKITMIVGGVPRGASVEVACV